MKARVGTPHGGCGRAQCGILGRILGWNRGRNGCGKLVTGTADAVGFLIPEDLYVQVGTG